MKSVRRTCSAGGHKIESAERIVSTHVQELKVVSVQCWLKALSYSCRALNAHDLHFEAGCPVRASRSGGLARARSGP